MTLFCGQFGIEVMQCYGITETSPAANVNQPDPPVVTRTGRAAMGKRAGSVGRLMPGMSARIVDPETGAELSATTTGMLLLKGANVFTGYLRDPEKTVDALRDGWFVTGDLGRFDDDGFLYIEGASRGSPRSAARWCRMARWSRRSSRRFGWEATETPNMAVVGVPIPSKASSSCSSPPRDCHRPVARTSARRRTACPLDPEDYPPGRNRSLLGSGKLDLKSCKAIALQACD